MMNRRLRLLRVVINVYRFPLRILVHDLARMGVDAEQIGDSTGRLQGI